MHPNHWLAIKPAGLYCVPGDFYIDPKFAVDKAVITHAHSDHARAGHKTTWATPETITIMKVRYGDACAQELLAIPYKKAITLNKVSVYLLPAGHILGSAQVVLEYSNQRVIVSGDYKRRYDPTCESFVVEPCDVFITEATFGLPVFKHPPIEKELTKLLDSVQLFHNQAHLVGAYALGKCQRVIKTLRLMNYQEPIYLHGALAKLSVLYQSLGIELGELRPASELTKESSKGKIILCPPSALHDRFSRKFANPIIANASGWMQIKGRVKQKGIDLPLIISDHADWYELTQTIADINPKEVWVTHGREEALVYYATQKKYKAQALHLLGYEEEEQG